MCCKLHCHKFIIAIEVQCAFATCCDLSPVENPRVIITFIKDEDLLGFIKIYIVCLSCYGK